MMLRFLLLEILQLIIGFHTEKVSPFPSEPNKTLSPFLETKVWNISSPELYKNARSLKLKRTNISLSSPNIAFISEVPIMVNDSQSEQRPLEFNFLDISTLFENNNLLYQALNESIEKEISLDESNITSVGSELSNTLESRYPFFDCEFDENQELSISCKNVSIYTLTKFLPNDTVSLEITDSPTVKLLKPLFSSMEKLKYLRLTNNKHRYITKAFVGLENLQHLDLSNNSIIAIKDAFSYLTNLKYLNLSRNSIITIGMVANAVKGLRQLEVLVLDHNWQIFKIQKNELKPLSNSNITKLHLFNTTLSLVEKGSFEYLSNLELLDLSVNYLNEDAFENVTSCLKNKPIKLLHLLEWVHLNAFPTESLKFLENTSIYRLDLSHNYFLKIHKLPHLPTLRSLRLAYCSVKFIDFDLISQLPNLTELFLSNNNLVRFKISSSKSLKTLVLSDQSSRFERLEFCLPDFAFQNVSELEIIDLSKNLLPHTLPRFAFYGLKKLRVLSLKAVGLLSIEDFAFETLNSLESLNLQINNIKHLSNATLFGLNKLTNLYLSNNLLILFDGVYPFHSTPSLTNILLDNNRIVKIPRGIFAFTDHLEILILSRNKILPWNEPIFGENFTVSTLGMSQNHIDHVTPIMLSEFRKITSFLDIGRNLFNCSKCGTVNFQNFLNSTHLKMGLPIPTNQENVMVKCTLPKSLQGKLLVEQDVSSTECLELDGILSIFTIVLISLASIFVIIMAYTCYTFRWYVRYWMFHIKSKVKERRTSKSKQERVYKYDAFVSYNSNDAPWIVSYLIPALENEEPKLKLCIHDRDFEVGRLITENILEAIENSRKVILILTEEFVRSEWCMFELHMAQHKLFDETRDCLILIKLKQVNKKLYTKNLKYLEKTRTCLLWPDDLKDQKLFWVKVRKLLGYSQLQTESEVKTVRKICKI